MASGQLLFCTLLTHTITLSHYHTTHYHTITLSHYHTHTNSIESSRSLALEKLWSYIASIVSGSLIKWSIVITRFGKPSTSEVKGQHLSLSHTHTHTHTFTHSLLILYPLSLSSCPISIPEWPTLIPDDGLLTANQDIRTNCSSCTHTSFRPHFINVIVVSVQPERNIQLFPNSGELINTLQTVLFLIELQT